MTGMDTTIQDFIFAALAFLNETLIPFILAIAFLIFIWNTFRYFILGGASPESQKKAKQSAIYGIAAFVVIVSFWGIVNLLVQGFGFDVGMQVTPDYIEKNK